MLNNTNVMTKDRNERFNIVIKRIEDGEPLRKILSDRGQPSTSTFYRWLDSDKDMQQRYARACEMRADKIFEEILEIADNPVEGVVIETNDNGRTKEKKGDMIAHRRLQVDARKWMIAKMQPEKYGDRIKQDININQEQPLFPDVSENNSNK